MTTPPRAIRLVFVFGLTALLNVNGHAQQVPTLRLAPPQASPSAEFTFITDLVELKSTPPRVLVVDQKEGKVVLLDPSSSTTKLVGRRGSGPAEYRGIQNLVLTADGGAYVVDFALRRLLPVTPDGQMHEVIAYPAGQWTLSDRDGRLYGTVRRPMIGRDFQDTSMVVRWDPRGRSVDTLVPFNAGNSLHITHPGEKRKAFPPIDAWLALPNGDVVVLEAATYRMHTFRDAKLLQTSSIPWQRSRVADADKQALVAEFEASTPVAIGQPGRGRGGAGAPGVAKFDGFDFPQTFPAFDNLMDDAVHLAPTGHIWVTRTKTAADPLPQCDVIGSDGKLLARVVLPKTGVVRGFGKNTIYVVEKDADDIERIRQYAYPTIGGVR